MLSVLKLVYLHTKITHTKILGILIQLHTKITHTKLTHTKILGY